jgi:aromatase
MSDAPTHRTTHQVDVAAPAGVVYGLVADAPRWPLFLPPNLHVEQLAFDGQRERLRMWAAAEGQVVSWTSARVLDPEQRRVDFRQETSFAPLRSMSGAWQVQPLGAERCRLSLLHDFTLTTGHPADEAWAKRTTQAAGRDQLERLAHLAARWRHLDELVLTFTDTLRIKAPAELVYDFLYRADAWPGRVPGVEHVELAEDTPGIQSMTTTSRTPGEDRTPRTTASVRICFPHAGRIVFKHTANPPLVAAHCGEFSIEPDESGLSLNSVHHIVLAEQDIETVLGPGADLAAARRHVRGEVGAANAVLLSLAQQHAHSAVRIL